MTRSLLATALASFLAMGTVLADNSDSTAMIQRRDGIIYYVPTKFIIIHGVLMALCFLILFPLGAIFLRTLKMESVVRFHGAWQTVTYLITLAGAGLGIWIATRKQELVTYNGHAIIGLIVVFSLFFMPMVGAIHHSRYRKTGQRSILGRIHLWSGRFLLVLGVINGGLGAQLALEDYKFKVPYAVIAAVMYSVWLFVVVRHGKASSRTTQTKN